MLFTPNTLDTGYNEFGYFEFMNEHQNNKQQCSVSSGGSRISQTEKGGWGKNLLFDKIFSENRMKMKEMEPEGARDAPPPGPANAVTLQ